MAPVVTCWVDQRTAGLTGTPSASRGHDGKAGRESFSYLTEAVTDLERYRSYQAFMFMQSTFK